MQTELLPVSLNVPTGSYRSCGVHVSQVIRHLAIQKRYLKLDILEGLRLVEADPEEWWNRLEPLDQLRMSIGLAWEQWYLPQLGNVVHQPGEMQVDGIYMTHDGESLDMLLTDRGYQHVLCLHEVKTTSKSTKTVGDLSSQWMWLTQCKAYCKGLKTLIAYIHVLFLYGDYKYPLQPQLRVWRVTFTQQEIDATWDEITREVRKYS